MKQSKLSEQLLDEWRGKWERLGNLRGDEKADALFKSFFIQTYAEARQKKESNKKHNFFWKKLFILIILAVFVGCAVYCGFTIDFQDSGTALWNLVGGGLFLTLLFLGCSMISKWIDIKKYQETWARHLAHVYGMEREMLLFLMGEDGYELEESAKEHFVKEVIKIEDRNIEKACGNLENKEGLLTDILDRLRP